MPDATAPPVITDTEMERLQALLDALPPPLEPLDTVMLDGYLCGVLLQPSPVPESQWWPGVIDIDARPAPAGLDTRALSDLVRRRHAELGRAIEARQWFDPWVYELDEDASPTESVMPWVAGLATAMERFPRAAEADAQALVEPMALLYQYLDAEDLEDADELLAEIETLEPPATMAEAVEDLVRAVLLWADVTRPRPRASRQPRQPRHSPAKRAGPGPARRSRTGRRA